MEANVDQITRRELFVAAAAAALNAGVLGEWARAGDAISERSSAPAEIRVTHEQPTDLIIDRARLRIAGRATTSAITINGGIPAPTLRMREDEDVVIRVRNRLRDQDTSIHWHGLLVPSDMDGVPGVSYPGIRPGQTFTYRFKLRQHGTYWYHSHSGFQEQLGHYGALIIDPAEPEPFSHDCEHVVVLSDWTFEDPYTVFRKLKTFEGYYNFQRQSVAELIKRAQKEGVGDTLRGRMQWEAMRMDPTDIADVTGATLKFLMNGRSPAENWTAVAKPGQRIRLRLINAATSTFFDFRIPGLSLTVVAADGQYVRPVETDELRLAVAETYDVLVTLPDDRAYTLFAEAMDRSGYARGTLASREGLMAAVPARRPRPLLTMADMGMAAHGSEAGDAGMKSAGHEHSNAGSQPSVEPTASHAAHDGHRAESAQVPAVLATEELPSSVMHGPDQHGAQNSMTAMMPMRRYAEPGIGLGQDGWRVLTYADLRALRMPPDRRAPDRQFDLHLTGNMGRFIWGMDGKKFSDADTIRLMFGERVRINVINDTMMAHPMHLHGMWMDLYAGGTLHDNPRKHTVAVKPGELLTVDITVDAPGHWAFHCHLLYHMEAGMFRTVAVVRSLGEGSGR
jgi:CopA family copper-resistance protein